MNQSIVARLVLIVASCRTYRILKRQVRQSSISIFLRIFQFVMIHIVKGFGIVNKAEINVFLEVSCFFNDPTDVAISSLVPLPFLNPARKSGGSRTAEAWLGKF